MQPAGRPAVTIQQTADQGEADEFNAGDDYVVTTYRVISTYVINNIWLYCRGRVERGMVAPPGGGAFTDLATGATMGAHGGSRR